MAITWGSYEGASPNSMRLGIDVSWEDITTGETAATATIKVYLDVNGNWSDTQTITMTGSGSGSTTFSNTQNNSNVLRYTDSYTFTYSSSSYGSSPGTRTFGATLSGAFNGATPSVSKTVSIPARPYAGPLPPTNVNTTRISDASIKTTWSTEPTAQRPWTDMQVQRDDGNNDAWNAVVGTPSPTATSFTDSGTVANYIYRYQVRSHNSINWSAWVKGDVIQTTPAAPTSAVRTGNNGANQVITWVDNANSFMLGTQNIVERSNDNGAYVAVATLAKDVQTWTDTFPASNPAIKVKYRVRTRTTQGAQGTLYSAYSNETTQTTGVTTPPNAPTNLAPTNNTIINPTQIRNFTWQYNSTDTTAQTQYQIAWRLKGDVGFTTEAAVSSATAVWAAPANKFSDNVTYEWMVATRGTSATWGPYSAVATFRTVGDPNALREQKRVMRMNTETGQPETATVGVLPPIGSLMMFGGQTAPAGWLVCAGQAVSRSDYVELFGVIGTRYGAGDGSTTFTLPNLTSKFPRGAPNAAAPAASGGDATITTANLPAHAHTIAHSHTMGAHGHAGISVGGNRLEWASAAYATGSKAGMLGTGEQAIVVDSMTGASATGGASTGSSGNAGSGTDYWQPYVDVVYIIKA